MNAHIVDENGFIINTILVDSLDFLPNLVDASIGGGIGDRIVDGELIAKPLPVPQVVTMRQARLALLAAGKLNDVSTAIDQLPSPQKEAAHIEWEFSSTVERNRPLVQALGPLLGLTEEELDNLFRMAETL